MSYTYKLRYYTPTGYADLDLGDEVPAMTYQINQLNKLKDRNASYSQSIDLPKTRNNLRILGFPDCYDVVSPAAYDPQPCELELDGAIISPPGAMLYILSVGEEPGGVISTQIKSDTFDLFSKLGEVDTENMNDEQWASTWDPHTIVSDNADADSPRIWPLVCTIQGARSFSPAQNSAGTALSIPILQTVPAYNFLQFITELLAKFGYNLESDLLTDDVAKSVYLTASNMTNDDGANNSRVSYTGMLLSAKVPMTAASTQPDTAEWGAFAFNMVIPGYDNYFSHYLSIAGTRPPRGSSAETMADADGDMYGAVSYIAQQGGSYHVRLLIGATTIGFPTEDGVRYIIQTVSGRSFPIAVESRNITLPIIGQFVLDTDVDVEQGDYIYILLGSKIESSPTNQQDVQAQVIITPKTDNSNVGPGVEFNYPAAFGFSTYRDALQTFLQLFGAIIDVQRTAADGSGTARIYTYRHIYDNITSGNFVDWSDRLVMDEERTISFSMDGYGQTNIIEATENEDDGTSEQVTFSIANKLLDGSKTLFTLATEAGRDISFRTILGESSNMAVVPTLVKEDSDTDESRSTVTKYSYEGCGAHIVSTTSYGQETMVISGNETSASSGNNTTMPIVQTVTLSQLFEEYYTPIVQMLQRQRPITVSLLLTAADIVSFDPFKPVWIEHYGSYFYVSKISNFQAGQATAVDLIPM